MANQSKAFISFDFIFSLIPVLLIVSYSLSFALFLEERTESKIQSQILFNKLVSASNYVVRVAAAKEEGLSFPEKKIYPNLIPSNRFSELENSLSSRLRFRLRMGFEEDGFAKKGTCIYRLVVYEPTMEIRKLYFCGE